MSQIVSMVEHPAWLVIRVTVRAATTLNRRIAERAGIRPEACDIVCADYFVRGTVQDDGVFNVFHILAF